ncbi:hypothetical protein CHARACLAT_007673 [Characodon lateralis]|uniref:Uncharacterized protein n=1 Tax=Characodon lateralis TaxID=208331 RepID=A0ABU7F1H7_9TELE|nr:hypothetical protein [Characodon lateralis]
MTTRAKEKRQWCCFRVGGTSSSEPSRTGPGTGAGSGGSTFTSPSWTGTDPPPPRNRTRNRIMSREQWRWLADQEQGHEPENRVELWWRGGWRRDQEISSLKWRFLPGPFVARPQWRGESEDQGNNPSSPQTSLEGTSPRDQARGMVREFKRGEVLAKLFFHLVTCPSSPWRRLEIAGSFCHNVGFCWTNMQGRTPEARSLQLHLA